MKVKTISVINTVESKNPYLSPNREYYVIGFDDQNYRIIDDNYEPVLYPKYLFEITDTLQTENWIRVDYDDGEYFVDPPELSEPYFYEEYFDGNQESKSILEKYCLNNDIPIKIDRVRS